MKADDNIASIPRHGTHIVEVGKVSIGGDAPISVQSMCKVPTTDISAVLRQCESTFHAGGDLIRIAIPDEASAKALKHIVTNSPLPVIADIHFDYKLALMAMDEGVHKVRINPGNIGSPQRIKTIANAAAEKNIALRIGVNAGSLPKEICREYPEHGPQAMVATAIRTIEIISECGFEKIVVSLKSSSPNETLQANLEFARQSSYPLHIGVTEAGFGYQGIVASTVGLVRMLSMGIGDTIRVSLSDSPAQEIRVGREILRFMGLRNYGIRLISCPMCARCGGNVSEIAREIWGEIKGIQQSISVAVMGCEVNGPGEAKDADIGVALGKKQGLVFSNGIPLRKVPMENIVTEMVAETMRIKENGQNKD